MATRYSWFLTSRGMPTFIKCLLGSVVLEQCRTWCHLPTTRFEESAPKQEILARSALTGRNVAGVRGGRTPAGRVRRPCEMTTTSPSRRSVERAPGHYRHDV